MMKNDVPSRPNPAPTDHAPGARRWIRFVVSRTGAVLVLLAAVAAVAVAFAVSPDQPTAQPDDGLPAGKQSTRVTELAQRFPSGREQSLLVVLERSAGPLTAADRAAIDRLAQDLRLGADGGLEPAGGPAIVSDDGRAALLVDRLTVPATEGARSDEVVDLARRTLAGADLPVGLSAQVTGDAAFAKDLSAAFDGADTRLLIATTLVVAVLLIITYRSPVLWIVPLVVIGLADQFVAQLLPWVAHVVGERTDAAVSGIVSVLVFGAGTDYALLLISRYREELRRYRDRREALAAALSEAVPAIAASAATVILAVLTLLAAALTSNRTLGISAAIGVAVALLFGAVVLPAALACLPRGVFWPAVPRHGTADPTATGWWSRVANLVRHRPVPVLAGSVVILLLSATGLLGLRIGLSQTQQFRTEVPSVTAQGTLARHFAAGSSQPLSVIADAASADRVAATAREVEGVARVSDSERSDDGTLVQFTVPIESESGSAGADRTVQALRAALADLPGARALVGGPPAADLDTRETNARDNAVVAPLVLVCVLVVLVLLLGGSLLAPFLLIGTVGLSFAATLGAADLVLRHGLGLPALDDGVLLLSFLFLVALGVDYNIFLVTRAKEETRRLGSTREGMLTALRATGGVITSAGVLLAAVFTVLGVLPVIVLTQIGVIVGLGVLIDTLLVRTLLVPSLAVLLGPAFWWPARPGRRGRRRESVPSVSDQDPVKTTVGRSHE